ncbi:MAG: phosphonate C-P lyase system protein PhnG [Syntrophobacteraceae bacterium]
MSGAQPVIMSMDRESLKRLSELLSREDIGVLRAPQTGLLMAVAKDAFATDFCLGEVLVTEAEAEFRGWSGYAMVMGDEPEKAMLAASAAAIFEGDDEDLKGRLTRFLAPYAERLNEAEMRERRLLAKTVVSFETMVKG